MDPGLDVRGRLFFAVVPDANTAAKIYRLAGVLKRAHRFGGDLIAQQCLHVSLLFLGYWSEQLAQSARETVDGVKMKPFEVSFDRTVSFRGRAGNLPFVLMGDDTTDRLKSLAHTLGAAVSERAIGRRTLRNLVPHITLLYGERAVEQYPVEPIRWRVNEFVLIHSLRGHAHLARWRFDV